jgi:hypothetical protein
MGSFDNGVAQVEICRADVALKCVGDVTITGASEFNVTATDIQFTGDLSIYDTATETTYFTTDVGVTEIESHNGVKATAFEAKVGVNGYAFSMTNAAGDVIWGIKDDGKAVHHEVQAEVHSDAVAAGDTSMYIGSARYSYSRASHTVTLHRLKTNHVPAYLQSRRSLRRLGGHQQHDCD